MKKQKYYINFTDQERSEILSSLLIKKNKLTHQGKFTDGIDEVICKVMKARTKLFKIKIVLPCTIWKQVQSSIPLS